MRILVGCEMSGRVRDAFIRMGHDAVSCDILPSLTEGPHIQGDLLEVIDQGWDMLIAFPPCTYLASSGLHWNHRIPGRAEKTEEALEFVRAIMDADIPKIVVENPVGRISTAIRKPDQIIHPWMFGHPESKTTCLWLKGVPLLEPTDVLEKPASGYWDNQTPSGQNKLGPSPERAMLRSLTYTGIAEAMAKQWGKEEPNA